MPFELNIIGEALKTQKNYFNKIKNLKDKINNNTNNKITFLGRQKKNKIRKLLNESDLYILPSLSEGLSLSLIEAMSTSSLCLISNNSNNSKLILNKKNGFTFKLSNESFNKSLIEIINLDTKKKRLIKKHARETILKLNLKNNFHE